MGGIIIIGGGASGMMAALSAGEAMAGEAAETKRPILLLERNEKLGKKLYITGKGRCNLTNSGDTDNLLENTPGNPYFLYSAFYTMDSGKTMELFENLGVKLKVERGGRVFPVSEKASDVVRGMERGLRKAGVEILLNTGVSSVVTEPAEDGSRRVTGVKTDGGKFIPADCVIIATGGLSYPMTGSTGDGYEFAKAAGHRVTNLYPSIVPLTVKEKWVSRLMGLSLKNVAVNVRLGGKSIYKDFGEMLFTHFGVSGPVVLSASRYIMDKLDQSPAMSIDLKPALDEKALDARLLRDFQKFINKDFKNSLDELLPQKLIPIIISLSGIPEDCKVNEITKEQRKTLLRLLKNFELTITGTTGFNEAVITVGGICVDEIEPGTMSSKKQKGLYFAGEVIDVDAYTGGYNLQIAFSTGYLAGRSAALFRNE